MKVERSSIDFWFLGCGLRFADCGGAWLLEKRSGLSEWRSTMTRCVYPVRTGARFEIRLGYLSERERQKFLNKREYLRLAAVVVVVVVVVVTIIVMGNWKGGWPQDSGNGPNSEGPPHKHYPRGSTQSNGYSSPSRRYHQT